MKVSSTTEGFSILYDEKTAVQMLIDAGYDAIDLGCFEMHKEDDCPKLQPNYKEYAAELRAMAEAGGVYFNQAHAPFPSSVAEDDLQNQRIFDRILRSIEFASLVGVRNIVVHPKQHLKYTDNAAYLKELNLEFYRSLIPYAKDYNIHIALENMWQYNADSMITHSTCSRVEEFKEYLDLLDSEWTVACLDIGHAHLMHADIPAFIHGLGDKLQALHTHATGYNRDFHLPPYTFGNLPWEDILKALGEIDYQGELTFEADSAIMRTPKELHADLARYMVAIGRHMAGRVEHYRKENL